MTKSYILSRAILTTIDDHLKGKYYFVGDHVTLADIIVAFSVYPHVLDGSFLNKFKNLFQWLLHFGKQDFVAPYAEKLAIIDEEDGEKDDDDVDLFDDDDDDEREAEIQRVADQLKAEKLKKGKVAIGKSVVVLDVKPWDDETDLDALENDIRNIKMEGLEWKRAEKRPVAFGVYKLSIMCHIVDTLVSVDDLQEKIEEFEEYVQSTDVASFSKL